MSTILLTGATGQVGSTLAPLLRKEGHRVIYLARPSGNISARMRLREATGLVIDPNDVVEGDVTLAFAGIGVDTRDILRGKIDKVLHSAASTKFDDRLAEETLLINLQGTHNMVGLADELHIPEFHFISTAYVAGDARYMPENILEIGQTGRNPYERSKLSAERFVRGWTSRKTSIYRPSIVIGDSKDGNVSSYTGYYGFFLSFWRLRNSLRERWEKDPDECRRNGFRFEDGVLYIPLHINCSVKSPINLVTSDWLAQVITGLVALPATGMSYNLTHSNPTRVVSVIDESLQHLGIRGISYGGPIPPGPQTPFVSTIQRTVDKQLEKFGCYINHEAHFQTGNVRKSLGEDAPELPPIDATLLARMLDFAVETNFGRREASNKVSLAS